MNERILELAKQAGYAPLEPRAFADDLEEIFLQKFALLIVRECVSTLYDMHMCQSVNNQNYSNSWHDAVDQGIDAIKEHFGVEE